MIKETFSKLSIRRKFLWITSLISLASLFVSSAGFVGFEWHRIREAKMQQVSAMSDVIAASLVAPLMFNDKEAAQETLQSLKQDSSILHAWVKDKRGAIFSEFDSEGEPRGPLPMPSGESFLFSGTSLFVEKRITSGNDDLGSLLIEQGLSDVVEWLRKSISVSLIILFLCALITFSLSHRFEQIITGPVLKLIEAIADLSKTGNYSRRVVHDSGDEIGLLVKYFNQMIAEVQSRDQRLRSAHEDLEKKVTERTWELTNEVLERVRIEQALRREQQQLQDIIRNSPVAIAMLDTEMRYLVYSNKWIEDYNLGNQDLTGKNHYDVFPNIPEAWKEIHRRCLQGAFEKSLEDRFELANGTQVYLRWAVHPWIKSDGTQGGVVMVTDRIDDLVDAREAALHTAAVKSNFLANMSHELRTPLNGIIGFTDLLMTDSQVTAGQATYLEAVRSSGTLLLNIINDILDFSKLEQGKVRMESTPFSAEAVAQEAVRIVKGTALGSSLNVRVETFKDIPETVWGDSYRLRQILINLVGNAVKFTSQGEVVVSCTRGKVNDSTAQLQFSVSDTGIGIPEDKLAVIFEAFSQADGSTTRKYGGTGLGLSICVQLVKLMNGEIWVESTPGQGSQFHFTVEMHLHAPDSVIVDKQDETPSVEVVERVPMRVLVAEDNPLNQKLMRAILEKAGYQVHVVDNGEAAVAAVKSGKFDLVLMDIQMPKMGGIEATKTIKSDKIIRDIPIVALTAHANEEKRNECIEAGVEGFLTKPFNRQTLMKVLARFNKNH